MKTLLSHLSAMSLIAFISAQSLAQLPNQPFFIPAEGDYGAYAVQDQAIGPSDPALAKAYDNFSLSEAYVIDGFGWTGVYAEPLPNDPADTDFIVEIWNVDPNNGNFADIAGGPVLSFTFEGGSQAGQSGPDLAVTQLGHFSPMTATTPGGGRAFGYDGTTTPTLLSPGDYWISIIADQQFVSPDPIFDPEWQWHLGQGPNDGFTAYDRLLDPANTPEFGVLMGEKDLAFQIKGSMVPEPSCIFMLSVGLVWIEMLRRKRH